MAHLTLADIFDKARSYLDTDELNFPDTLLDNLLQRIWYQAVTMEREWRFFQRTGSTAVVAGTELVPFDFDTLPTPAVPAVRVLWVKWGEQPLVWRELTTAEREWTTQVGEPVMYSERNDGNQRNLRLFPMPGLDGVVNVGFIAEPVYPVVTPGSYVVTFADLPDEFDAALQEGLVAEMYMREEDPDLYQQHRQMFLEQMGSIRNRWKESLYTPIVMAGRARLPGHDPSGFAASGAFTQPAAT